MLAIVETSVALVAPRLRPDDDWQAAAEVWGGSARATRSSRRRLGDPIMRPTRGDLVPRDVAARSMMRASAA